MQTTDAPAATRPALAALLESDPETVAHILCAEFGGADWELKEEATQWWVLWQGNTRPLCRMERGRMVNDQALPRPLHDDGDAWRLMVREDLSLSVASVNATGKEYCAFQRLGTTFLLQYDEVRFEASTLTTGESYDPRRAVVLAVLHKHAHDPRWSSLIPSVIERLEQAQ